MATKPELRRAVANGYIKASDYNYNFEQLNNYIENGVADNAINNYEADREYSKGQWVLANTSEGKGLYESQVDGNKGNSLLDTTYWKKLVLGGALNLFDTVLKDHVLTYEESKGLALQGTYVYKEAIAGSRYGYPYFYNKCLEEYNEATTTETINGVTVKVHSNGHKFYNINDKAYIDEFFNAMGSAWFYGVDTENERIFLPRDKYFAIKGVASSIPVVGNGLSLGFTDGVNFAGTMHNSNALDVRADAYRKNIGESYSGSSTGLSNTTVIGVTTDASKSGLVANSSNVIQTNEDKYLYICVGNTTNYEGMTDVVNQGMEILEQVAQKVNIDGTNLNTEGKTLITSYSFPSNRYIDLTLGAAGTNYIAPANGFVQLSAFKATQVDLVNTSTGIRNGYGAQTEDTYRFTFIPVKKGDGFCAWYSITTLDYFRFIYAEGEL